MKSLLSLILVLSQSSALLAQQRVVSQKAGADTFPYNVPKIGRPKIYGNGGKGGDILPAKRISEQEIRFILDKIQLPLYLFFNNLSITTWNDLGYMGTLNRTHLGNLLFKDTNEDGSRRPTIFSMIRRFRPSYDCKECDQRKEGMAVLQRNTNYPLKVWFNIPLIAKNPRLSSQNAFHLLLAHAAHEYSHLLDTTDEEAELIQKIAEETVSESIQRQLGYTVSSYVSGFSAFINSANQIVSQLQDESSELPSVCLEVGSLASQLSSNVLSGNLDNTGLSIMSRSQWNIILPQTYQFRNLISICRRDHAFLENQNKIFQGQQQISVMDYLARAYPQSSGHIPVSGVVPYLQYGLLRSNDPSVATLETQLISLREVFRSALEQIKVLETLNLGGRR